MLNTFGGSFMSANGVPFKPQALMRDLQQRLQLTLSGAVTFTQSLDAYSMPNLLVLRGTESLWIHIEDAGNAGRVDGLGLPQRSYSPNVGYLLEASVVVDADLRSHCLAELTKSGTEVQLWSIASIPATFPSNAAGAGAALTGIGATQVSTIKSDANNPLTEQM
jgi:hypothetical protein